MKDKYQMTLEQNIFVVKRNLVDYIWKSANLEGIAVTYPDTQCICDGMSVSGYTIEEINAVNDLKHAWQYLLEHIREPMDVDFLCRLHRTLGWSTVINAGSFRLEDVRIGGTDWIPELPSRKKVQEQMEAVLRIPGNTERAIELMLLCMRGQYFYDGNKRLAMLAANQVMISSGAGILTIPQKKQREFLEQLVAFYESGEKEALKAFVWENGVDGISFSQEEAPEEETPEIGLV